MRTEKKEGGLVFVWFYYYVCNFPTVSISLKKGPLSIFILCYFYYAHELHPQSILKMHLKTFYYYEGS